jgi:hypothetical protein
LESWKKLYVLSKLIKNSELERNPSISFLSFSVKKLQNNAFDISAQNSVYDSYKFTSE